MFNYSYKYIQLINAMGIIYTTPVDLSFNGIVERANTGDAMGNPLNALAWLANLLAEQGRPLKKGNIVMSGSTLATKFLARDDHAIYNVDGVGSVEVQID